MSFYDRFLKKGEKDVPADWHELTEISQLDTIIEESYKQPVAIFKHSTTCGISYQAKVGLEEEWDIAPEELKFYYLDLLAYRPISNEVANKLGIVHQSPQVIILKNGKPIDAFSHHSISVSRTKKEIA